MTGKKDEGCGHDHDSDSAIADELAPMRKWEQGMPGTGSYTEGPTHLDRADFRDGDAPTEAKSEDEEPPSEG